LTNLSPSPLAVENYARTLHPITHIYHTADPIPFGACTGITSLCAKGGYALETGCHLGMTIVYDTVSRHRWSVNINNHRIARVVALLEGEWAEEGVDGETKEVPEAEGQEECVVCTFSLISLEIQN
jgi:lipase ATG15